MEPDRKPLCFIPARGESKRLPSKNIALLQRKPLIAWTIESALASGIFDSAYVSSEDDEILHITEKWGGTPLKRSRKLSGDRITLLKLCLHEVERFMENEGYTDLYLLLPTSPFRKASTIREAWKRFVDSGMDSLMSVVPSEHPPQWALTIRDGKIVPLYPDDYTRVRQELHQGFYHDGGHLITRISIFLKLKTFVGANTIPFQVSAEEAVDINEPIDLAWAEFLLEKRKVN